MVTWDRVIAQCNSIHISAPGMSQKSFKEKYIKGLIMITWSKEN